MQGPTAWSSEQGATLPSKASTGSRRSQAGAVKQPQIYLHGFLGVQVCDQVQVGGLAKSMQGVEHAARVAQFGQGGQ